MNRRQGFCFTSTGFVSEADAFRRAIQDGRYRRRSGAAPTIASSITPRGSIRATRHSPARAWP